MAEILNLDSQEISMLIDAAEFPLVWMRSDPQGGHSVASPFAEFEALLARKETFVLLNDERLDTGERENSAQELKQTSLWMKRHKSELRAFVNAAVYIEPSTAKRLAAKAFAMVYQKFWGYPMLIVATKAEALALARKLLRSD